MQSLWGHFEHVPEEEKIDIYWKCSRIMACEENM